MKNKDERRNKMINDNSLGKNDEEKEITKF